MPEPLSRTEKILLQLLLIQTQGDTLAAKVLRLSRIGLSNAEIADLVGATSATVAQSLYMARSKGNTKAPQPGRKRRPSKKPVTNAATTG
jgi:DNA-binding CsgD family transcriptional regulator